MPLLENFPLDEVGDISAGIVVTYKGEDEDAVDGNDDGNGNNDDPDAWWFVLWDATRVWMGRVLVTIVIVVVWDAYCAFAEQKRKRSWESKTEQPLLHKKQERLESSGSSKTDDEKRKTAVVEQSSSPRVLDPSVLPETTISPTEDEEDAAHKGEDKEDKSRAVASVSPSQSPTTSPPLSPPLPQTTSSEIPTTTTVTTTPAKQPETQTMARTAPKIRATSDDHPGMEGFAHWYEVETSLYRIYTLVHRDPSVVTVPPYVPHSHRGNVAVELHVTNHTDRTINVFWVDYKGKYVPRGTIPRNGGVWTQTTWIDHPWMFEDATTSTPYLHYVPYRAIPTIPVAPTIGSDGSIGLHKFALVSSSSSNNNTNTNNNNTNNNNNYNDDDPFHIGIRDEIMPFPAMSQLPQPLHAIHWTLRHLSRASAVGSHRSLPSDVDTLQKYLINILNHPDRAKYRQLRIASPRFGSIWASPLRGLLLAVGFVEVGPYAELGCHDTALSSQRVQDVALLSYLLNEWKWNETEVGSLTEQHPQRQPDGAADGFGRAGFGRAGAMG